VLHSFGVECACGVLRWLISKQRHHRASGLQANELVPACHLTFLRVAIGCAIKHRTACVPAPLLHSHDPFRAIGHLADWRCVQLSCAVRTRGHADRRRYSFAVVQMSGTGSRLQTTTGLPWSTR
jgi:hypothetical protein